MLSLFEEIVASAIVIDRLHKMLGITLFKLVLDVNGVAKRMRKFDGRRS